MLSHYGLDPMRLENGRTRGPFGYRERRCEKHWRAVMNVVPGCLFGGLAAGEIPSQKGMRADESWPPYTIRPRALVSNP